MKHVIVYWSRYGNGKMIVDRLSDELRKRGDEVSVFTANEFSCESPPDGDLYIFSAPAEKFTIPKPMRNILKNITGVEGKSCALINTHAMKRKNWIGKMQRLSSKSGMIVSAVLDYNVSGDVENGKGLPEGWGNGLEDFIRKLKA